MPKYSIEHRTLYKQDIELYIIIILVQYLNEKSIYKYILVYQWQSIVILMISFLTRSMYYRH